MATNPREWLAAYLKTRAHLSSLESLFRCDPRCLRPGCRSALQVRVSLIDLLGAAMHLDRPLTALFPRHYSLGLFAEDRDGCLRQVALKLRKPCPFLEGGLCGIYPVRPLPCALFPEYLVYQGRLEETAAQEHFRDYLCLRGPMGLSPARSRVMGQLLGLWQREGLLSSYYLFGQGNWRLDVGNLLEELRGQAIPAAGDLSAAGERPVVLPAGNGNALQHLQNLEAATEDLGAAGEAAAGMSPRPAAIIPHQVLEGFFLERIAVLPPFTELEERMHHLQTPGGQARFLGLFEDKRLVRRLQRDGDGRALVYRFARGKLEARRRSLLSGEYNYL